MIKYGMTSALAAVLLTTATIQAKEKKVGKATVTLDSNGYSASGSFNRADECTVSIKKSFRDTGTLDEKITALQQKIAFYKLFKQYGLDPNKKITAAYANKPLKEVFAELMPKVPVHYDGVEESETVKSMAISEAELERVVSFLGEAAGVYLLYSDKGITVSATLPADTRDNK